MIHYKLWKPLIVPQKIEHNRRQPTAEENANHCHQHSIRPDASLKCSFSLLGHVHLFGVPHHHSFSELERDSSVAEGNDHEREDKLDEENNGPVYTASMSVCSPIFSTELATEISVRDEFLFDKHGHGESECQRADKHHHSNCVAFLDWFFCGKNNKDESID